MEVIDEKIIYKWKDYPAIHVGLPEKTMGLECVRTSQSLSLPGIKHMPTVQ